MSSKIKLMLLGCAAAIALAPISNAHAQAVVPGAADASRVEDRFSDDLRPKITGERVIKVPDYVVNSAPAGAENQSLTLQNVVIDGATVYTAAELESVYERQLGERISLADVFGIAERLTVKYRNDGYILSQVVIPPQEIESGTVRFQVIEGYIDNVTIEGDLTDPTYRTVSAMADQIAAQTPLNANVLERNLLLMNDVAGFTVKSVLSPSTTTPGAADMTLFVQQKSYDVFFQADNRGSRFLGPLQLSSALRLNSWFGRGEAVDFQFVTAPDGTPSRELDFVSLDYTETVNGYGTQFNFGVSYTGTEPGFTLSTFDVKGRSENLHVALTHPLVRTRSNNLFVTAKFDITNTERTDNLTANQTEDRIRALRLGGTYQFTDKYIGINTVDLLASHGVGAFNATSDGDANLTRTSGRHDFLKLEAEVTRLQHVNSIFSVFAGVKGQKTNHILLSSEEFGVGGSDYGRAYDSSEIVGEQGIAAKFEVQMNDPMAISAIDGYQVYGYYDVGKVWDPDNTVVKQQKRSLAAVGIGVRFDVTENFSGSAELALPLTRQVQTENDTDPRAFFSLKAKF